MATGAALPETLLVLDNDVFTHWRNRHQYVKREINNYIRRIKKPPALTSMTIFEALYGIESEVVKGRLSVELAQQYKVKIEETRESWEVLAFDRESAAIAAYIFPRLSRKELKDHWKDLFIAATAVAHGYGVATSNARDFELIASHLPDSNPLLRIALWRP